MRCSDNPTLSSRHAGENLRDIKQSAEDPRIDSTPDNPNAGSRPQRLMPTPLSDDHSRVEPPHPIPNRSVKRSRANDSRQLACESRSSADSLFAPSGAQNPLESRGGFLLRGKLPRQDM